MSEAEGYEYIKAIIDCGSLRWEYLIAGYDVKGRDAHDEDVSDWTEEEILTLTKNMLDVPEDQADRIEIIYA